MGSQVETDICRPSVGVVAWYEVGGFKEDVCCISDCAGKWGDGLKETEEGITNGIVWLGFVVLATLKEMITKGVGDLATLAFVIL